MQVEGQHKHCLQCLMATGARVRNAYVTYLKQGHNTEKLVLIPHNTLGGISWG